MTAKIKSYRLKEDQDYTITKLLADGKRKVMSVGKAWVVTVGERALVGALSTSPVQEIILVGKGVIVETENSTYLIEEFEGGFLDVHSDEG